MATSDPSHSHAQSETANPADSATGLRPEVDRIIQSGQQPVTATGSAWPVFALTLLSGGLLWTSFAPVEFAPAAWVALVPLCLLIRLQHLPARSYRAIYAASFFWSLVTLQWMRLGHVTMYGALLALSLYMAFYTPVFVALARTAVRARLPVWAAVPITWVTLEYLRSYLLTGFSWYYLAHSQYRWHTLVQISDVTGAYGVSFLLAAVAAAVACCIPARWLQWNGFGFDADNVLPVSAGSRRTAVAASLGLVVLVCGYGSLRLLPVETPADGPTIAVVQGNFTPELKHDPRKWTRMWTDHYLMSRNIMDQQPDLIVWPETMFPEPNVVIDEDVDDADLVGRLSLPGVVSNSDAAREIIRRWRDAKGLQLLKDLSLETGSALLIGQLTEVHRKQAQLRYNSASFFHYGEFVGRYDKIHRVIFGEYIPLKNLFPWLSKFTPFSAGFGINAGIEPKVFVHGNVGYAPLICFEDTVPHLVRRVAATNQDTDRSVDVLVNLTNDAWFRGSSELDQHLIISTFRCIETRRPMVRAVNAGISAYIDSCGRIRKPETMCVVQEDESGVTSELTPVDSLRDPKTGRRWRQNSMVLSGQLPLDSRPSVYLTSGDWFSIACLLITLASVLVGRFRPRLTNNEHHSERSPGGSGQRNSE